MAAETIRYNGQTYTHQQRDRLVRDLTAAGHATSLSTLASNGSYYAHVHDADRAYSGEHSCTPWAALCSAIRAAGLAETEDGE